MRVFAPLALLASSLALVAEAIPAPNGPPAPAAPPAAPAKPAAPANPPKKPSPSNFPPAPQPKYADIPNGAFSFKSAAAKKYHVGRDIPTVPFKVPESWSGLMPLSGSTDRDYFFWLYPSQTKAGSDDLIIWNNGGPGCSSLEGLLQELGPYVFPFRGPAYPNEPYVRPNPYSWTNLSSVVFTEQPIGTGFTQGTPTAANEIDVANDFYSFLINFFETFPELKGKRLWLAGESYAGKYIPYMASKIYNSTETNKKHGINLQGIAINDPSFTGDFFGEEASSIEFAHRFKDDMLLSDAFLSKIDAQAAQHNFTNFVKKNLVYPPPAGGIQIPAAYAADANYDPWGDIYTQASKVNPNFNVYNVATSNLTIDPLGFPPADSNPSAVNILNDIPGLKELIHAPNKTWYECSIVNVFPNGDASPPPDVSVLPAVIEKSQKTIIQHGNLDYILLSEGSQLAIQNMTWAGGRGFQKKPSGVLTVAGKKAGSYHEERKLTFMEITNSGHMIPQDKPAVSYKATEYLLGRINYAQLGQ